MLKKIITFMLIAVLMATTTITFAGNSSATTNTAGNQTNATSNDSLAKLNLMGIIDESDLNMTGKMSREVFSKLIVNSTGNYELAQSLSGSTTFSDVAKTSKFCGYINAAVNKGYLSAFADGKFKPNNTITYAQLCTAMIKALGYTSSDIIGTWPNGYIEKAKNLGLTTGFSLKSNDEVSTSATITMITRMLNTNIKKANSSNADVTLKESVGLTNDQTNWVYGEPEVAFNFNPNNNKLGNITFKSGIPILRNTVNNTITPSTSTVGEIISLNDIKDKDVVYEVYNKLNVLIYYLVVDNKIEGEITSILPSKYTPTAIEINNVKYDLGEYVKIDKFNSSRDAFNVGDDISAVLGYDGKLVDAYYMEDDNNKEYAFVVNCATKVSTAAADYGKTYYTVDLMHVDGTTKTYKIEEDPNKYEWRLVKYSSVDDDTVALLNLSYRTDTTVEIDKNEKKVNQSYTSNNVKIFNYTDETVNLLNWDDMPDGTLPAGKVKFIATAGDFEDICVILTSDVLNQQYKNYVVQSIKEPDGKNLKDEKAAYYAYNLVSGANKYTYYSKTEISGATTGSVFSMKMYNNNVSSFNKVEDPNGLGWYIQAIDSKRLKMNNWIYMFNSDVTVYLKDYSGNLAAKKLSDIVIGTSANYGSIKLYCDRPINNGGKVQTIIISLK